MLYFGCPPHSNLAVILLTPFRFQNVPPPMSSHQLVVSPESSTSSYVVTPIYITFSCEDDTLAVLWEHGYIELWSLKIRPVSGNTKILDPSKVWSGWIVPNDQSTNRFRQLTLKTIHAPIVSYSITTLGANKVSGVDHIYVVTIQEGSLKKSELLCLPQKNTRLLTPSVNGAYEMCSGDIFTCE